MKIHSVEQGTFDWLLLHVGRPTASEFSQIMTSDFELRKGDTLKTYLAKKVAEKWRGQPLPAFGSWASEQGLIIEEEALPFFALQYDCELRRVGFMESDDSRCGCSPDSIFADREIGLEVKSPQAHTHVSYLLDGKLPPIYQQQVHGSLFVSGWKRWLFMSYRRAFPPLVIQVERDEAIMAKIKTALDAFYKQFDEAMARLKELNAA